LIVVGKEEKKEKKIRGIVVAVYSSQNKTNNPAQPHHSAAHMHNCFYSQSRKTQGL